jgi:uncharacterized membrane protein YgcG
MAASISRRAVLGGGVALGAAALLTTREQPARAQVITPITGGARVGATFDLDPFEPAIKTYPAAVADWNAKTGTTMKCWKLYFQESKFPSALKPQMKLMIEQGIQAMISFKPTPDISSSQGQQDTSKLKDAVEMLSSATIDGKKLLAEVCLWQEVGPKDMTSSQYKDLVAHYGPIISQHFPLVFDAPGYQGPKEWAAYKPDDSLLDGYAIDFYCDAYVHRDIRLEQLFPLAGNKPVGVWEIGNTATSKFTPTPTDVENYMGHITQRLSERLASGLPVGSVAWYNGPADSKQSGQNEIVGTHPCQLAPLDIKLYRTLYAAVNGKSPTAGGSGPGGSVSGTGASGGGASGGGASGGGASGGTEAG